MFLLDLQCYSDRWSRVSHVAADEWNEAAIEMVRHCDVAVAKPEHAVYLINRVGRLYDCCAAERSLARLVSCYGNLPRVVAVDEWNEATFERVAVAKPEHAVCLINRGSRFHDCFAAGRSLA